MDPQQRVMLQTAYRALEDAGYVPDSTPSFSRQTFGCFIGNATLDYTDNLRDRIDVYYSPGKLFHAWYFRIVELHPNCFSSRDAAGFSEWTHIIRV